MRAHLPEPVNGVGDEFKLRECRPRDVVREQESCVLGPGLLPRNEDVVADAAEMAQPGLVLHIPFRLVQERMDQLDGRGAGLQQGEPGKKMVGVGAEEHRVFPRMERSGELPPCALGRERMVQKPGNFQQGPELRIPLRKAPVPREAGDHDQRSLLLHGGHDVRMHLFRAARAEVGEGEDVAALPGGQGLAKLAVFAQQFHR
jgi:hypothetical protein